MTAVALDRRIVLTDEQRAAVEWGDGPLMVLAGAGTGKTTVVVERVRHLLDRDPTLRPENILVLTYNVRAAAELTRRFEQTLGLERASRLWAHNFHSFGYRLLNAHRAELGLNDAGNLLDQIGQRLLLRDLRPRMGHFLYHDLSLNPNPVLGRFADMISRAKDELVLPAEFAAFVEARRTAFVFQFGEDAWAEAVESIRRRKAEQTLAPIWEVRGGLRDSIDEGIKLADRAARRTAAGINYAVGWTELTPAQKDLAEGLKPTYLRDAAAFEVLRLQEEAEVYDLYQRTLHERGLVDFGEQQLRAIELLQDRPNLLLRYQSQFRHVLVDEFQDANMAQILLLELVGRGPDKPDNVVVVGDDDQSIYRFRGASYAAFSQFETRFGQPPAWAPDRPTQPVVSLPLLENRRSTANILAAANRLIEFNKARLKSGQPLRPIHAAGPAVEVAYARDEADEADLIVDRLQSAFEDLPARLPNRDGTDRPRRWSDLVVLYRRHRHREAIVERLRRAGIPYSLVGATGLFLQPEIRDLEAALRVCGNPADNVAFARLLTAGPWRFDAGEILLLTKAASWDRRPVFEAATEIHRAATLEVADLETGGRVRRETAPALRGKLAQLFGTLDDLVPRAMREGPFTILEEYLVRTNLLHDLIAVETPDAQRSVLAIARLMRFASDWQREHPRESLVDFVAYLDLYQEIGGDLDTDAAPGVEADGVQLMTIYQAKGLEYEVVVVPRLIEGQFPDSRDENLLIPVELLKQRPPDEFSIAEERRLLFVAMTRARTRLLLTAIDSPTGKPSPSRFTGEVAPEDEGGLTPADVVVSRRAPAPDADVEVVGVPTADDAAAALTPSLERLMPVPAAFERRYELRRRAVELIGALERVGEGDAAVRAALIDELGRGRRRRGRGGRGGAPERDRPGDACGCCRGIRRPGRRCCRSRRCRRPFRTRRCGRTRSARSGSRFRDVYRLTRRRPQGLLRVRHHCARRVRGVHDGAPRRPRRRPARARLRDPARQVRRGLGPARVRGPGGCRPLRRALRAAASTVLRARAAVAEPGDRVRAAVRVRARRRRGRAAGPAARLDRPDRPPSRRHDRDHRLQDRRREGPGRRRQGRAAVDVRAGAAGWGGSGSGVRRGVAGGVAADALLHRGGPGAVDDPVGRAAGRVRRVGRGDGSSDPRRRLRGQSWVPALRLVRLSADGSSVAVKLLGRSRSDSGP